MPTRLIIADVTVESGFLNRLRRGLRFSLDKFFKAVVKDAQRDMQQAKTGRYYRRPVAANPALGILGRTRLKIGQALGQAQPAYKLHRASAPGESPAIDQGVLYRNLRYQVFSDTQGQLIAETRYASYLEDGTNKMAPRPYLRPALLRMARKFKVFIDLSQ